MIFDMTRRSSGGGGGPSASDAILTVTVPTGSTVTMTKGGITLTPTMWVQAEDNTLDCALFVIQPSLFDANAWTVTASLSGNTASATVTIDSNEQYDMILSYRVPPAYQEVEYLAASGTQYINTGVHPEANYAHVIAECLISSNSTTAFGVQAGSIEFALYIRQDTEKGTIYCGTSYVGLGSYFSKSTMHKYDIIANNGYCVTNIDGHIVNLSYGGSLPSTLSLFLFAENSSGTALAKSTSRFHRFAMLDELGNYLCDLYSAYRKSDSVPGMYDRVSKTFKTNDGSGIFTVGPDVT